MDKDYKALNRESWNQRTAVHFDSEFYDNTSFIAGRNSLNAIEMEFLQAIEGKSVLHLQCHFGQDTISFTRLGAKAVGVDLSDEAIAKAKELATTTGSDAQFICSDIYALPQVHQGEYDLVFASYGTIGWLPDVNKWAEVVSHFLKPGGKLVFAEFHPFIWMHNDDFTALEYSYFNVAPIHEIETSTYAGDGQPMSMETFSWNHPMSDVLNALLNNGLQLEVLREYDYSPYNCFPDMEKVDENRYRIKSFGDKAPIVYALVARKA